MGMVSKLLIILPLPAGIYPLIVCIKLIRANYAFTGVLTWMVNSNTLVEARAGYATVDATFATYPRDEQTNIPYMWDGYTGYYFGTGYYAQQWNGRPSVQASAHLTRFVDNFELITNSKRELRFSGSGQMG